MEDVEYQKFLQIKRQAAEPFMPLINAAQVWMDSNSHLQSRLHQQSDPGDDNIYKVVDFLYATFFGTHTTVTAAASVALTSEGINGVYCVLDQDVEFTIASGAEWQRLYLILKEDTTGDWEASFGSGFGTIDAKTAAAGEYIVICLIYDSVNALWHEIGGSGDEHTGTCGSIFYKPSDANIASLPPDNSGSGYMVLMSQGECKPPRWFDIVDLINFIAGGGNLAILREWALEIPGISMSAAAAVDGGYSNDMIFSVLLPLVALSGAASTGSGGSENPTFSVPVPSVSMSGAVL